MIKNISGTCPRCGEGVFITCNDINRAADSNRIFYSCNKCNAEWEEIFVLLYMGFSYNGDIYNSAGKIMTNFGAPEGGWAEN